MCRTHENVLTKEPLDSVARFRVGVVWDLAWIDVRDALDGPGWARFSGD